MKKLRIVPEFFLFSFGPGSFPFGHDFFNCPQDFRGCTFIDLAPLNQADPALGESNKITDRLLAQPCRFPGVPNLPAQQDFRRFSDLFRTG